MVESYQEEGKVHYNSLAVIVVCAYLYEKIKFENEEDLYQLGINISKENVDVIAKYWPKVRKLLNEL